MGKYTGSSRCFSPLSLSLSGWEALVLRRQTDHWISKKNHQKKPTADVLSQSLIADIFVQSPNPNMNINQTHRCLENQTQYSLFILGCVYLLCVSQRSMGRMFSPWLVAPLGLVCLHFIHTSHVVTNHTTQCYCPKTLSNMTSHFFRHSFHIPDV